MTISVTADNRIPYTGNGSTTEWAVPFQILKKTASTHHLKVIKVTIATGAEEVLVENTGYTVTQSGGDPSTGTVTISPALSSAYKLYILTNITPDQNVDLVNSVAVDMPTIEKALDKLTLLHQQSEERLSRAILLPETTDVTDLEFPSFDGSVEGDIPTVNSTTDGYVYKSIDELVSIAAFDINALTAETTVNTAADYVAMYDASATAMRKVLVEDIVPSDATVHGNVQQVVHTTKTDTFTQAIGAAGTFYDVTGMSLSITPSSKKSKILVGGWISVGSGGLSCIRITIDGIMQEANAEQGIFTSAHQYFDNNGNGIVDSQPFYALLDVPTTSATTIKLQISSNAAVTVYVNRSTTDTNSVGFNRAVSHMWAMEILQNPEASEETCLIKSILMDRHGSFAAGISTTEAYVAPRKPLNLTPLASSSYNIILGYILGSVSSTTGIDISIRKDRAEIYAASTPGSRRSVSIGNYHSLASHGFNLIETLASASSISYELLGSSAGSNTLFLNTSTSISTQGVSEMKGISRFLLLNIVTTGTSTWKQVVHSQDLTTSTNSTATTAFWTPSLARAITPVGASNYLLVSILINAGVDTTTGASMVTGYILRDSSNITTPTDTPGSRSVCMFSKPCANGGAYAAVPLMMMVPATTASATTFGIKLGHNDTGTTTLCLNRSFTDTDNSTFVRGISQIGVIEIDPIA